MSDLDFAVLINDELVILLSPRQRALISALKEHLPPSVPLSACKFYQMRNPVPVGGFFEDAALAQACAVENNRILLDPRRVKVGNLAQELSMDYVYVVVDIPDVPRKRTAEEADILAWVRSAKIGKYAPSNIGFAQYSSIQRDYTQRILDDRPFPGIPDTLPDDQVPPISLVYQPFGKFLDTYLGVDDKTTPTRTPSFLRKVDEFAYQMTLIHADENDRRDVGLLLLNQIFGEAFTADAQVLVSTAIGKYTTNGSIVGNRREPIFLVEFKNEASSVSVTPIVQLCAYYFQFISKVDKEVVLSSRLPALALTVVGPVVTFYAVAFLGQPHCTPLTSSLSCIHRAVDGNDRLKLYNAFGATIDLLRCIINDHSTPSSPLRSHLLPAITELPTLEDPNASIKFEIIEPIIASPGRYIYKATSPNSTTKLVVKFTRRYSSALHIHCARQGHAPTLRGYAELPGNIIAVAMDFVDKNVALDSKEATLDDQKSWADQLTRLVESFHAAGFVHGDLRYPNILVVNKQVILIDYDWAGKEGKVFYPHGPLAPQLTEGRNQSDLVIRKEDDRRVLANTLKEIGIGS